MRYGWAVLAGLALTTTALAQDVSGNYVGKYKLDLSKFKPEDRKMAQAAADQSKLSLQLRKDMSFVVEIVGVNARSRTEGTYKVQGGKVITTDRVRNGKPVPNASRRSASFTIADNGKTLRMKITTGKAPAELIFTRK